MSETITSIGEWAFTDCKVLKEVTIPSNVYRIDKYAFGYSGVKTIRCKPTTPPSLGEWVFDSRKITLYVPYNCKSDYEGSDWSKYIDKIIEM